MFESLTGALWEDGNPGGVRVNLCRDSSRVDVSER